MSRPEPDAELSTMVRDAAPRPSAEFLERLDARVADRFGAPQRPRRAWTWTWRRVVPAFGAAGLLVAVVAIALSSRGGDDGVDAFNTSSGTTGITAGSARPSTAAPAASTPKAAAGSPSRSAPAPSLPSAVAPAGPRRRVIRDTTLALVAAAKDFTTATDGVIATADRFGGIVQRSDVSQTGSRGHASFDLRVPAGRLDEALAALSRLAHVKSRSAAGQDVTADYMSASERLSGARAERRGILRALAKAGTAAETEALRIRLREVDRRLARARGDVASLKRRTDYVRVAVTVDATRRGEAVGGTGGGDDRWTPGDALHDAGRILQTAAGVALIALAIGLPLGLVGGLAVAGGRVVRRRRRDAVLG